MLFCATALGSGDILRQGASASSTTTSTVSQTGISVPTTQIKPNPTDQLARTTQALAAVRAMQAAAMNLAVTGPNSLAAGLPSVPTNSYQQPNGLVVAAGVPANLASPVAGENPGLWTGASLPTESTSGSGTAATQTVTIQQTAQQAVLNWQSFNIGKNTVLDFDQATFGGADVTKWIAFNKIGVTGNPSQILGSIQAAGQVYIVDTNGIIFGGSAQINTHTLVASSLPINDNLIASGLLDNPDGQFLFSGIAQAAGVNGPTPVFTPLVSDAISPTASSTVFVTNRGVADPDTISVSYNSSSSTPVQLVSGTDYTVKQATPYSAATVTLTTSGLAQVSGSPVTLSYSPIASSYGDVSVQPGATIFSPTSDNTGGRIALIGPNVTNAGTLSAPNGQVILAAGLQVGFAAHPQSDPSLRGLDVYVGQVTSASAVTGYTAGSATNAVGADGNGNPVQGLIETSDLSQKNSAGAVTPVDLPGSITLAGMAVNQMGVLDSSTTVSFNGRADLLADYNAESNSSYNASVIGSLPFVYPTGNSTGVVTLGPGSLLDILPSSSQTDKIVPTYSSALQLIGGLALRSAINIQANAVHLESNVPDGSTSIPSGALAATIFAPNAEVNIQAGSWNLQNPATPSQVSQFIASGGQVFLDQGAQIDVSGTQDASASVTENIVAVQLLGAQLADAPLQRNGALRGQTVYVDLRVHGPWDPATNSYAWVGTPLADASGYIGLVQRTADELTTAGGTVNIQAGGSVVMQPGSAINVSGGWIDYQPGYVQTTKLISGGQIYDISDASPDIVYSGIYTGMTTTTNSKWGVTQTTVNQTQLGYMDPGYVLGGNAGALSISSASVALDGGLSGQAFSGPRQILTQPGTGSDALMALPGQFSLTFSAQYADNTNFIRTYSPTPPNVVFQSGAELAKDTPASDFMEDPTGAYALQSSRQDEVDISPSLATTGGFGYVAIDTSGDNLGSNGRPGSVGSFGNITIPVGPSGGAGATLTFGPGSAMGAYFSSPASSNGKLSTLSLTGANIEILGGVTAPGGTLAFEALDVSPTRSQLDGTVDLPVQTPDPTRGTVILGSSSRLDVSGQVLDYRLASATATTPVDVSGGQVSLQGYQTQVQSGSSIDVSGGAVISATGKVTWGAAGGVSLAALDEEQFDGAGLLLPSTYTGAATSAFALSGYSGSTGGTLSLLGPLIQIGGAAADDSLVNLDPNLFNSGGFQNFAITGYADTYSTTTGAPSASVSHDEGLLIGSSILPTSIGAEASGALVQIRPVVSSYKADLDMSGKGVLQVYTPVAALQSPVNISLTAKGDVNVPGTALVGSLVMGSDASIVLNANASGVVRLKGDTVAVYGGPSIGSTSQPTISAPGGSISITGSSRSDLLFLNPNDALATVYLGPNAVISAAGAPVLTTNGQGFTVGTILPGGSISVTGNIVAEKGAYLDVSGSFGVVDLAPYQTSLDSPTVGTTSGKEALVANGVYSNGGTLSLNGGQELFSDATLVGDAGAPATGGTLNVQSGQFLPNGNLAPSVVASILLVPGGKTLTSSYFSKGVTAIGQVVTDASGNPISIGEQGGVSYFGGKIATTSFSGGGFDWLNFNGSVGYSGAVTLTAGSGIAVGTSGIITADPGKASMLSINAPYVALGAPFQAPSGTSIASYNGPAAPTYGTGSVSVTGASLIDIGNLSFQNIGNAELQTVAGGDVRGDGTVDVAGNLTFKAGQVYPPTAITFNIGAYDPTNPATGAPVLNSAGAALLGTVTFERNGTPSQVPLSAGGMLNVYASDIVQDGILRAPLGQISIGLDGATKSAVVDPITGTSFAASQSITVGQGGLTSVSTVDLVTGLSLAVPIPYGNNLNGTAWIDPTGANITVSGPATKQVTISAANVNDQSGSTVDIAGGGDLYAYHMVSGVNGTVDILSATSGSFAIVPGYDSQFSPYGAFNTSGTAAQVNLGGDPGYVSSSLRAGNSIYLDLGTGSGPQTYTLLPARYALLPGAYLVTPEAGSVAKTVRQADGSSVVEAYAYNALATGHELVPIYSAWDLAPASVVRTRAEYDDSLANTFFAASAAANGVAVPRLPEDAGQLVLLAGTAMTLKGSVNAAAATNSSGATVGLGGLVDIASPQEIVVSGPNTDLAAYKGDLVLSSADLTDFGADSLLIGGYRTFTTSGTDVTVLASNVLVDNGPGLDSNGNVLLNPLLQPVKPGSTLAGSDITLVANRAVGVAPYASIEESGKASTDSEKLIISDSVSVQPGETVGFYAGGVPISFPQGASFTVDPNVGGFVTLQGAVTGVAPGSQVVLAPGSTFTFNSIDPTIGATLAMSASTPGAIMVTGDGAALRVSSDPNAQIVRSNVSLSSLAPVGALANSGVTAPGTSIFQDSTVSGGVGSVIIDSTNNTTVSTDPAGYWPAISAKSITFDSGSIGIAFANSTGQVNGLLLPVPVLQGLINPPTGTQATTSLSLLSYSSIGTYGSGTLGSSSLQNLALHAAELVNESTGSVTLQAVNVQIDNSPDGVLLATGSSPPSGTLSIKASDASGTSGILQIGSPQATSATSIGLFAAVNLSAAGGVLLSGAGGLNTLGAQGAQASTTSLSIEAPVIAASVGANQTIATGGALSITSSGAPTSNAPLSGLGANAVLEGASVNMDGNMVLPSGTVSVHATAGTVEVGGMIDVSGRTQSINDVDQYTGGGKIILTSDTAGVTVAKSGTLDVSAAPNPHATDGSLFGDAGSVVISATDSLNGLFIDLGTIRGQGGLLTASNAGATAGNGGTFSLDVGRLTDVSLDPSHPDFSLMAIDASLNSGGFTLERDIRVRNGDVTVEGAAVAHTFDLSADNGSILVTGLIDASGSQGGTVNVAGMPSDAVGNTGGAITLSASGSVVLGSGAQLSVSAANFDAAGKGGIVSLNAGTSTNGVAPATNDTRDPSTGAFKNPATPVVDIQAGSTVDLSVAAATVALSQGTGYYVAEGMQDVISSDVPGTISTAGVTTPFAAGVLPSIGPSSTITLLSSGHLTLLTNAAAGTFTGTLALRAPQTIAAASKAGDVQINPINGTIVAPSGIVVEGYKTYTAADGYIDSTEVSIDQNGRLFASASNTGSVISSLTRNWGQTLSSGAQPLNGLLSLVAGVQLHVRPGAEIDGATGAGTTDTVTFAQPGTSSSVSVPAGITVRLPSTTPSGQASSFDSILFSTAVTLTSIDAGSYTVSSLTASNPTIPVLATTSVLLPSSEVAGALTSTAGGTITLRGTSTPFAAGALPAIAAGSTLAFSTPGTLTSTTGSTLSLTATTPFSKGAVVSIPANSTVALGTDGGSVIFAQQGTLTWVGEPQLATQSVALQVAAGSPVTLPSSNTADNLVFSSDATLIPTAAGSYVLSSINSSASIPVLSTTSILMPASVAANTLTSTVGGTVTVNGSSTTFPAGPVPMIPAGGTVAFSGAGSLANATATALAFSDTTAFPAGATVSVPASSSVALGTRGGAVTFANAGTIVSTPNLPFSTNTFVVSVPVSGSIVLPSTTAPGQAAASESLTVSSAATVTPVDAGTYTSPVSISTANPTLNFGSASSVAVVSTTVQSGDLTSSVGGAITLSNGTTTEFAAGPLPSLAGGSVLTFSGAGTLTNVGGASASVKISSPFAAGASLNLPAQSVVTTGSDGASAVFGPTAGTITASVLPGSVMNAVALQLPSGGSFTTGSGGALIAATGGTGTALTLGKSSASAPGAALALSAGGSVFFPNGTETTGSNGTVTSDTLQIGPSVAASLIPSKVTLQTTDGGIITFQNQAAGSFTTGKGGTQQLANTTLTTGGIQIANGGQLTFGVTGQIVSTEAGTIKLPASLTTTPLVLTGSNTVILTGSATTGAVTSTVAVTVTQNGSTTSYPAGALPALAPGSTIQLTGGSLALAPSGASSLAVTISSALAANVPTTVESGSTVKFLGSGLVAASSVPLIGVSIVANLAPGVSSTFAPGDVVTLANSADVVTLTGTGAFNLSSPGPTTVLTDAKNMASDKVSFVAGSGNLLAVVTSGNYSTTGVTGLVTSASPGDLTLAASWDLSNFRYGPNVNPLVPGSGEPGDLVIRAPGNLNISSGASLSDGFVPSAGPTTNTSLWQATLLAPGSQSWSYTLVGGSDLLAAEATSVLPQSSLPPSSGSVLVGVGSPAISITPSSVTRTDIIPKYFETIRTGTGGITVSAGTDVQLLDSLATIYTAGTMTDSPTSLVASGDFDTPNTYYNKAPGSPTGAAGGIQNYSPSSNFFTPYPAQFSYGGGDVTITAQQDIAHYLASDGTLVADSSAELPTSWLYRRGYTDATGAFGVIQTRDPNTNGAGITSEVASTSWWVDFSNFFEGVGTLGGGNTTLSAGRSVNNVDAIAATNERTTKQVSNPATGKISLSAASQVSVELGGGNVSVSAGDNINGGVYYVERGTGTLVAGGQILTNATRSTLNAAGLFDLQQAGGSAAVPDPTTWMPTTLFLGAGSFDVSAGQGVELGSVANPFLLPQGIDNSFYQTSYFSTFATSDSVRVSSLQGDVTIKTASQSSQDGSLLGWYSSVLYDAPGNLAATSQPWLRLNLFQGNAPLPEAFATTSTLMPATLSVTAFSGDINLQGNLTLSPSASGTLNLIASGSINGLQPTYLADQTKPLSTSNPYNWTASLVDISDADPDRIPSVYSPLGYLTSTATLKPLPAPGTMDTVMALFDESGATSGNNVVLQTELALHGPNPDLTTSSGSDTLHGNDTVPAYVYAGTGDISGLTLYSAKPARVIAGQDVTDVGLYIQNTASTSISVVSAGNNLLPYDSSSPLLLQAAQEGSQVVTPQSGDIQISGPGTLEVIAGHNLELGESVGQSSNGLSVGVTSIGNTRNPFLPFAGANVMLGAGLGAASDLAGSSLDFAAFDAEFLDPTVATGQSQRYLPDLGALMGFTADPKNPNSNDSAIWAAFNSLPASQQSLLALDIYYDVLRDAGRDFNTPGSPGFRNFFYGYGAIATLFGRKLDFSDSKGTGFDDLFLNPATGGAQSAKYLPYLGTLLGSSGMTSEQVWDRFQTLPSAEQEILAIDVFGRVLNDASAEALQASTAAAGAATSKLALQALLAGQTWNGNILLDSRSVETTNGGDINVIAPGGGLNLGFNLGAADQAPPGIITAHGGNISIFTNSNVDVGVLRIFTLFGGNEIIWSTEGNIAAGAASKTVQSAPPTQVLVDPQSADVQTDLAGLATGGGIGVLATISGVKPGDIDLVAPAGVIDAGDAGIRASGKITVAAPVVLNSGNIQAGGAVVGTPPAPAAPNIGALAAGSNASAAASSAANAVVQQNSPETQLTELPSIITVDVLGYGGGDDDSNPSGGN